MNRKITVLAAAILALAPAGAGLRAQTRSSGEGTRKQIDGANVQVAPRPTRPADGQTGGGGRRQAELKNDAPAAKGGEAAGRRTQRAAVAGAAGSGASAIGEVSIAAGPETLMLRLDGGAGMQALEAVEGGTFSTDVVLLNRPAKAFDRLRIEVFFNPAIVSPKSVSDAALAANCAESPTATVDRKFGHITYEATLRAPLAPSEMPLMTINWEALKPTRSTPIDLATGKRSYSEIYSGEEALLGLPEEAGDGTVGLSVRVLPADPAEAALMQEEPQLYLSSDERVGGVELSIVGPEKAPRVGEVFAIDLVLDNRAQSQMDGISVLIGYDPRVLTILDADRDNWITLGANIHDGPFRLDFPFDYHVANTVYPSRGVIEYRAGTSRPEDFLGLNGTFARIYARAKKPTAGTALEHLFASRDGMRTTAVKFLGQDALGDSQNPRDGVKGLILPVKPELVTASP